MVIPPTQGNIKCHELLPTELWHCIVKEIISDDIALTQHTTRRSLCALARTCRSLYELITPILFDTVFFQTTGSFNRYVAILGAMQRAPPVTLTIDLSPADSYASAENPSSALQTFFNMVLQAPRLKHLNVRGVPLPASLFMIHQIGMEQIIRVSHLHSGSYPFNRAIPLDWWSFTLKRVCLGPEQVFDEHFWGLIYKHETVEQIILQCTTLKIFSENSILDNDAHACYDAIRRTVGERKNPKMPRTILMERLHSQVVDHDLDPRAVMVLRAAGVQLVSYFCNGLSIYDAQKRPVMHLSNKSTWEVLRDEAFCL